MNKIRSPKEAVSFIKDDDKVMIGGSGPVGCPLTLIEGLSEHDASGLTIISVNLGASGATGLGKVLLQHKVAKAISCSFAGNKEVTRLVNEGRLDVEHIPQSTLFEAIRAGGAGIGGFYTRTASYAPSARNKEKKVINNVEYVLEEPIRADVALIKAMKADLLGNLVYYKATQHFNPLMAMAADTVIVEVEEIVDIGELNPETIVTPHLYVDMIVQSKPAVQEKADVGIV